MAPTSKPSSARKESPNWLEMPDELMVCIFQRLPSVEVLKSTRKVCTTWGRICKYPAMWKVINMIKHPDDGWDWNWDRSLEALTKEAVDLSCGELIDITIEGFCTDELLNHIVLHSIKLKRLCLWRCFDITNSVLGLAVKKVPQLEELHLAYTIINAKNLEVIGRNCPQLKFFKMTQVCTGAFNDHPLAFVDSMPELRHLELSGTAMTNDGLEAILNACPHLQSLYLRNCLGFDLNGNLGKLCRGRIKNLKYWPSQKYRFYDGERLL